MPQTANLETTTAGWDDPLAGGAGDIFHLVGPFIPKKFETVKDITDYLIEAGGTYGAAIGLYGKFSVAAESASVWSIAPGMGGLSTTFSLSAGASLVGFGVFAGASIAATTAAGWETGTWISGQPWGPGGQTVSDFWAGQFDGAGNWMQQNTSFGH